VQHQFHQSCADVAQGRLGWSYILVRRLLSQAREQKNIEAMIGLLDELSWSYLEKNRWDEMDNLSEVETLLNEALRIAQKDPSNDHTW
jgi:hypothetical protein